MNFNSVNLYVNLDFYSIKECSFFCKLLTKCKYYGKMVLK